MLALCLAAGRSRGRSALAECMMGTGNIERILPAMSPRLLHDRYGVTHSSSQCGMCALNHRNQQLCLRQNKACLSSKMCCSEFHSRMYWSSFHFKMYWSPFQPRISWSPFHTSAPFHTCTFNPDATRVNHLYRVSQSTTVYPQRRNISHSLTHHLSKPEDKNDIDVDSSLQAMPPLEMRRGGGHQNPWKLKRLRFTRHVMNLVKKGKVAEAQEVFGHMQNERVTPEVPLFNSLIAGYGRQGDIRTAFKLFNDMKKRRLVPTDRTYTSLFNACAEAGPKSLVYLQKIQAEMERRDVHLNNIASNALISALASCDQYEDAFQVYLDMMNMRIEPDIQTFGSLLAAASKDPERGLERAQRIWSEMLASGFSPDLYCYNLLLQCLRDAGLPDTMKQPAMIEKEIPKITELRLKKMTSNDPGERASVLGTGGRVSGSSVEMVGRLESTSVVHFTTSPGQNLTLYLDPRGLRWVDEVDVIAVLKQARTRLSIHTFHLLASLVVDSGYLLHKMATRKVKPDARFMVAAIRMQAQLRNIEGAKALLRYAESTGLALDQLGYQAIASSCRREEEGMQLLEELKVTGVRPNEFVFGTLIGNAARQRKYEYLTALLKEMKYAEVLPNQTILQIVEGVAKDIPTSPNQKLRHNGFNGYYNLWKRTMCQVDEQD